jgi:hypothetical protein
MADRTTTHARRLSLATAAISLALLAAACGDDDSGTAGTTTTTGPTGEEITEAGYAFRDSSVPPEYHRSWTLTVTAGQAYIVVDSYGDVVGEETAEIDASTWTEVQANVAGLNDDAAAAAEGCTGGTGAEVWALAGDETVLEATAEVCGDENAEVVEVWEAAFDPVLALFDMEALLAPAE